MTDDTLDTGEAHPSSHTALYYINMHKLKWMEPIYSCALTDNRTAQIAAGTLRRLESKLPVSDRYLMGLAWFIYELEEGDKE